MAKFNYTPDEDVKVHEEGAIRLISKAFQSHENGLSEWLKNSTDAYTCPVGYHRTSESQGCG